MAWPVVYFVRRGHLPISRFLLFASLALGSCRSQAPVMTSTQQQSPQRISQAQIIARIDGMANTSPWAKAGVMIRQSVVFCTGNACNVFETDGAPNVMLALTPSHGLAFQWRPLSGGSTFYIDAGAASAPVWVKLVKSGNTFTGYRSVDGAN